MPTATPADLRLVVAYIASGSTKCAAHELGMTHEAYRRRLSRLYRRQGVCNMASLIHGIGSGASQMAGLAAGDLALTL